MGKGRGHHRDTMGNLLKAAGASPVPIWSCLIIWLTVGHAERENIKFSAAYRKDAGGRKQTHIRLPCRR